jgi:hypothetical protein
MKTKYKLSLKDAENDCYFAWLYQEQKLKIKKFNNIFKNYEHAGGRDFYLVFQMYERILDFENKTICISKCQSKEIYKEKIYFCVEFLEKFDLFIILYCFSKKELEDKIII